MLVYVKKEPIHVVSVIQLENKLRDVNTHLDAAINTVDSPIFIKDKDYRFVYVNNAFCDLFKIKQSEVIGFTLSEKIPSDEFKSFISTEQKVLETGEEVVAEKRVSIAGLQPKILTTKIRRCIDASGQRFIVGIINDVTRHKISELREKTRAHVLELITGGEPLSVILKTVVDAVEQENTSMHCSVLLLDETGKYLRIGTAPSLPDFYNNAINGIEIGLGTGSCGTAAFMNERVIVSDIQNHPYWKNYRELAKKAGLASCWSQPIRAANTSVLGTFAIYHSHVHSPSDADIEIIEQTASIVSIAIEKKLAEEKLKRAASVFTHANEGIVITDGNASIIEVNETFTHITGYSNSDVLGKNPKIFKSGRHSSEFYKNMWAEINKVGHWRGEIWNRRKNGEIYPEMLTISAVKNVDGMVQHYVSLSTDITQTKKAQEQLERIAHYDLLTNLPNRVLLAERLSQAMKQHTSDDRSLGVAFMDLDGFKEVNDRYGHDIGDQFLVEVSKRINRAIRQYDTLARIGGDEFIIIMGGLKNFHECEHVLKQVLKAAATPVSIGRLVAKVSASIGVTLYPQDNVDAEQLIRHADQAMYVAKQAGKNRYYQFDTEHDNAINLQHRSIDNICAAIENKEFVLYYQPKVNMRTGEVIGVEALIRWQHPTKGLLSPAAFLPLIEGHSVSLILGEWVIETALKQLTQWQNDGVNLSISVNISAYQLQQTNFTEMLESILAQYPLVDSHGLELEILETSALSDTYQVSSTMHACHKLGVRFALDDFGTGYSSLTYLKRLPAYMIKIDQSFVRDMLDDSDDLAIVEGVVGLAKVFEREVIAEGVETIEHGEALMKLGCELAQGYGIARPMPGKDILQWISYWQSDSPWLAYRLNSTS